MGGVFWVVTSEVQYWANRPELYFDLEVAIREAQKRNKDAVLDGVPMKFEVEPVMVRTLKEWEQREELIRDLCFKIDVLEDELNKRKS